MTRFILTTVVPRLKFLNVFITLAYTNICAYTSNIFFQCRNSLLNWCDITYWIYSFVAFILNVRNNCNIRSMFMNFSSNTVWRFFNLKWYTHQTNWRWSQRVTLLWTQFQTLVLPFNSPLQVNLVTEQFKLLKNNIIVKLISRICIRSLTNRRLFRAIEYCLHKDCHSWNARVIFRPPCQQHDFFHRCRKYFGHPRHLGI